jgi:hypothetical protein
MLFHLSGFAAYDMLKQFRKVAPFTIKQNVLRYWMNRLWHNDPDALMVRRRTERIRSLDLSLGLLTDDEARITALNQYWGGGLACLSEPIAEMDDDRLGLLRHLVPALGAAAVPRDMYEGKQYPYRLATVVDRNAAGLGVWRTVSVVNWSEEPMEASLRLDAQLLGALAKEHAAFHVTEFWSGAKWETVPAGGTIFAGALPPHAALHFKVVPASGDVPILAYTDGHFSMGGTEMTDFQFDGETAKAAVRWPWSVPLTLSFAVPAGTKWTMGEANGVHYKQEGSWLDATIEGPYDGVLSMVLK